MTTENDEVFKSFGFEGIHDDDMRKFSCWGSVEVVDRQKEIIPIDEVYKIMDIWMDRGSPIMFNHSNRQVGKGLNWRPADKNGKPGVLITGLIFKHYKEDDDIWEGIKNKNFEGLSIGGKSLLKEKDNNGVTHLKNLIGYEFSVAPRIGNQEATFTEVNTLAKSEEVKKEDAPVMDETPEVASPSPEADRVAKLESVITALIEKISQIEEKISGKPEEQKPVETQSAPDSVPEDEKKSEKPEEKKEDAPKEEDKVSKSEYDKVSNELTDVKKSLEELKKTAVAKTLETPRPEDKKPEATDKLTEVRKTLKGMAENKNIDFKVLGSKIRE
jgi:hypothetical protein